MLGFLAVVTLFSAWLMPYADRRGLLVFRESESIRYVGLALNVIGGTLRLAGFLALGRQFSGYVTVQQDHQLVQTAVYRVIRHPVYLGVLLAFPGAATRVSELGRIPDVLGFRSPAWRSRSTGREVAC